MYAQLLILAFGVLQLQPGAHSAPAEVIMAEPLWYPHGRSQPTPLLHKASPQKQQQPQQAPRQQQATAQSSYHPQVVKPPSASYSGQQQWQQQGRGKPLDSETLRTGARRGPIRGGPIGDWSNDERPQLEERRPLTVQYDPNPSPTPKTAYRQPHEAQRLEEPAPSRWGNKFPTLSSLTGAAASYMFKKPKILISKPLYHPGEKLAPLSGGAAQDAQAQGSISSGTQANEVYASEQNAIEIPEMGGIEYYDFLKHIRTAAGTAAEVVVKAPGNLATAVQTAFRGGANIVSQVADNMPEIDLPSLPMPSLFSDMMDAVQTNLGVGSGSGSGSGLTWGEDSYISASHMAPLAPFSAFLPGLGKKKQPVESYWLDTYGV